MRGSRQFPEVLANYAATMTVALLGLWIVTRASSYLAQYNNDVVFELFGAERAVNATDILIGLCAFYAVVLIPYYAMRPSFVSDARKVLAYARVWLATRTRPILSFDERRAVLTLALKLFFVPLMVALLLTNVSDVLQYWRGLSSDDSATPYAMRLNTNFYYLVLSILLAFDVLIFTIGYIVEVPAVDNEIKSVDPTALGWLSCLVCYPPFNQAGFAFFSFDPVDATEFATPLIQTILAWLSLAALAVFTWASIALGLRASNLTNRGIVSRGPYRFVRHPAYSTKTVTIWIAALPAVADALSRSIAEGLWVLTCVAVWTLVYVVRALTEERHLLMIDNGYSQYRKKVRFRFVPWLF